MARKGLLENNDRRYILSERYAERRKELKAAIIKEEDIDAKLLLIQKLESLPRNSSKTRYRNRCAVTGRPRGYNKLTGLSRIAFREAVGEGRLPGFRKSRIHGG